MKGQEDLHPFIQDSHHGLSPLSVFSFYYVFIKAMHWSMVLSLYGDLMLVFCNFCTQSLFLKLFLACSLIVHCCIVPRQTSLNQGRLQ